MYLTVAGVSLLRLLRLLLHLLLRLAEPSPHPSPSGPLSQLVIAAEQKAASDTEEAAPHSDADAEVSPRERARKKLGHYQPKLSSLDRLEVCTTASSACPRTRRI